MPDFSTPAEHAFEQAPSQDHSDDLSAGLSTSVPTLSLSDRYSIESTLNHIFSNDGYRTIALQFPDDLLGDSVLVYRMLMKGIKEHDKRSSKDGVEGKAERQCYVLGDSTYGSCCPDVLSSLHLPADLLIHYGHACLTR
jgi:diphthamide biosynthesis protein 2